jgi:predicted nucleic acid-binding protein
VRVFVDTSALIALLDEDDERHLEASETFRSLATTAALVTHNYVHVEALAVARRRLGAEAAQRVIDSLFPLMTTIWVDETIHRAALANERAARGRGSLVDQVSFAVMRQSGIEVAFAFDADFELEGFRRPTASRRDRPTRVSEAVESYGSTSAGVSDLVSVAEIAKRAGRPVNTIQSWRRRHSDFPDPVVQLAAGPVWNWPAIAAWISTRGATRAAGRA